MGKRKHKDKEKGLRERIERLEKELKKRKSENKHSSRSRRRSRELTPRRSRSHRKESHQDQRTGHDHKHDYHSERPQKHNDVSRDKSNSSSHRDSYCRETGYSEDLSEAEDSQTNREESPELSMGDDKPNEGSPQRISSVEDNPGMSTTEVVDGTSTNQERTQDQLQTPAEDDVELEAEVLQVFGDRLMAERILAPAIHKDIAIRWTEIISRGLPLEEKKSLLMKYPPPSNCCQIEPPKLNPEVKAALDNSIVKRDERIAEKQQMIGAALAGVGRSLTLTLKTASSDKIAQLENLNGVARLLSDLQHEETAIRRSLILKNIKASFRDTLKDLTTDEWLFGQDLSEKLKAAKVLQQSTNDLKSTNKNQTDSYKGSKNFKGPPRRNQLSSSSGAKGGGQKQSYRPQPRYQNQYHNHQPRRQPKQYQKRDRSREKKN